MVGELVSVFLVSSVAFTVKGATGFGPAIFTVGLLGFLIGIEDAIVLAAVLDLASGFWMSISTYKRQHSLYKSNQNIWLPIGLIMAFFAVVGGLLLNAIKINHLEVIFALLIFVFGLWLFFDRANISNISHKTKRIIASHWFSFPVAALSGFLGGLIGIGGPTLILYMATIYKKDTFRELIIPILTITALARVAIYLYLGLVNSNTMLLFLAAIPGMALGLKFGVDIFHTLNEKAFWKISGVILIIISVIKLLN